jgi:hypothetical protein
MVALRYNFHAAYTPRFSDCELHGVIRDMCENVQTTLDLHQCHGGEVRHFDDAQFGVAMLGLQRNQCLRSVGDLFTYLTDALTEEQSMLLGYTLHQLPHLEDVDTTGLSVGVKCKMMLVDSILGSCRSLRNLTIGREGTCINAIDDDGARNISYSIAVNTVLESLSLPYNNIHQPGIEELSYALQANSTLRTLNLDNNIFGDEGLIGLLDASTHLRTLGLSTTGVSLTDYPDILPRMSLLTSLDLTSLHLHSNVLDAILCQGYLKCLKSLNLNASGLKSSHMPLLRDYILENSCLTKLDLSCNTYLVAHSNMGWVDVLQTNSRLTSLALDYVQIGMQDMQNFVNAIVINTTLTDLSLARFSCPTRVSAFASLIEKNRTLTRLNVRGCRLDAAHMVKLGQAINRVGRRNPISLITRGYETSTCKNTSSFVDHVVQEQLGIKVKFSHPGSRCEEDYIVDAFRTRSQEIVLAFAMGSHVRIGQESTMKDVAPDVVYKIAQMAFY